MRCRARPYEGKEPYIFVSYAHNSAQLIYPMIEQLVRDGYRVWYDEGLHPGDNWLRVIAQHLDRSAVCLAAVDPAFCASYNCYSEVSLALNRKKPVLCVSMVDFELPLESQLLLGPSHMLKRHDFKSAESFFRRLYATPALAPCRGNKVSLEPETKISGGGLTTVLVPSDPVVPTVSGGTPLLVKLDSGILLPIPPEGLSLGGGNQILRTSSADQLCCNDGTLFLDGRPLGCNDRVRLGLWALIRSRERLYVYFSAAEAHRIRMERKLHLLRREGSPDFLLLTVSQDQLLGRDSPLTHGMLTDGSVSRSHARLRHNGSGFSVMDLSSTNGTFLNGHRLPTGSDIPITPGDSLRVGDAVFRYDILMLH